LPEKYFWQGLEDHVGDMDFKIAGTRSGITAIQLDIKPSGIPLEILCEALEPALIARTHILEQMEKEIREPNTEQKENAPRKGFFSIQREYVGRLIGPQGSNVKNIERVTGDDLDFYYSIWQQSSVRFSLQCMF
jgi:polyribonucleotide nucleotidyltransferase